MSNYYRYHCLDCGESWNDDTQNHAHGLQCEVLRRKEAIASVAKIDSNVELSVWGYQVDVAFIAKHVSHSLVVMSEYGDHYYLPDGTKVEENKPKPPLRVVIESPLAGDFERNIRYALWCAYDCYLKGEAAYASHLFFPQFLDDRNIKQREFGITAGYVWAQGMPRVFYTDLGWSSGMERARDKAKEENSWGIIERRLTRELFKKFEAGEYPPSTIHNQLAKLKEQLTLAAAQNYCTMCGETLDGYEPPEAG